MQSQESEPLKFRARRIRTVLQAFLQDLSGPELVEWAVVVVILFLATVLIFGVLIRRPDLSQQSLWLAVFSAFVGGLAWSLKQAVSIYHNRAQLLILEILSDGVPRKRDEIAQKLAQKGRIFRILHLHMDALADLVLEEKIGLEKGSYRVEKKSSKSKPDSA